MVGETHLMDEPLGIRCGRVQKPLEEDEKPHSLSTTSWRSLSGPTSNSLSICAMFALLHRQPYDSHLKRKLSTGLVSSIFIPDTVAFRAGYPEFPSWYLSSQSEPGTIKRKNTPNVTPRNILEVFTRRKGGRKTNRGGNSGIVAVLISEPRPSEETDEKDVDGEEAGTTVEYLDEVLLRDFLDRRAASFSGILQKWVEPPGQYNSVMRADWTEEDCVVEARSNVRPLSDRRSGMAERGATFDGVSHLSRPEAVPPAVAERVGEMCGSLARHCELITDGACRLRRLRCLWKARPDGRLVLLWCPSVAIEGRRDASRRAAAVPLLWTPHPPSPPRQPPPGTPYVCPVSHRVCAAHEAQSFVTYKMVIHEWRSRFPAGPATPALRSSSPSLRSRAVLSPSESQDSASRPASARSRNTEDHTDITVSSRAGAGRGGEGGAGSGVGVGGSGVSRIPELIRRLENIHDVAEFERRAADVAFLYKQVRVSDVVARHFAAFAPSALPATAPPARATSARPSSAGPLPDRSLSLRSSRPATARSSRPATARTSRPATARSHDAQPPGPAELPAVGAEGWREQRAAAQRRAREEAAVSAHLARCVHAEHRRARDKAARIGPFPPQPPPLSARRPQPPTASNPVPFRRPNPAHVTVQAGGESLKALVPPMASAALAAAAHPPPGPNSAPRQPAEGPRARAKAPAAGKKGEGRAERGGDGEEDLARALVEAREREGRHREWLARMMAETREALSFDDASARKVAHILSRRQAKTEDALRPPDSATRRGQIRAHSAVSSQAARCQMEGGDAAGEDAPQEAGGQEPAEGDEDRAGRDSIQDVEDEVGEEADYEGDWDVEDEEGREGEVEEETMEEEEEVRAGAGSSPALEVEDGRRSAMVADEWTVARVAAAVEGEEAVHRQVLQDLLGSMDEGEQSCFLRVLTDPAQA